MSFWPSLQTLKSKWLSILWSIAVVLIFVTNNLSFYVWIKTTQKEHCFMAFLLSMYQIDMDFSGRELCR